MRLWRGLRARYDEPDRLDRLVVGLGNPGPRYSGTRHNLGRSVVLLLASRWDVALDEIRSDARVAVASRCRQQIGLAIPITYMNESGSAVAPLLRHYRLSEEQLIVAVDDLDLPLGTLRLRASGGSGGHRGLASISRALGTDAYARIRLGIGRPEPGTSASDYVLSGFGPEEMPIAEACVATAADAVEAVLERGLAHAMNVYND